MSAPVVAMDAATTQRGAAAVAAKFRALADELNRTYLMRLAMPSSAAQHLAWFDDGTPTQPARPVLVMDGRARDAARDAIVARVQASLRAEKKLNILPALLVGANAARAVWVERLEMNGADMPFAPLSPSYLAWKVRHGRDPRTGVSTGAMLHALRGALINVTRTR